MLLNAAAAFIVAGRTEDLKKGVALAEASIEEGRAKHALDALIEASHGQRDASRSAMALGGADHADERTALFKAAWRVKLTELRPQPVLLPLGEGTPRRPYSVENYARSVQQRSLSIRIR